MLVATAHDRPQATDGVDVRRRRHEHGRRSRDQRQVHVTRVQPPSCSRGRRTRMPAGPDHMLTVNDVKPLLRAHPERRATADATGLGCTGASLPMDAARSAVALVRLLLYRDIAMWAAVRRSCHAAGQPGSGSGGRSAGWRRHRVSVGPYPPCQHSRSSRRTGAMI